MHLDDPKADYVHKSQLRDFGGIGLTDGTRVGGTRKPRTYTRASACISYTREDKSDATIFATTRATHVPRNNNKPTPAPYVKPAPESSRLRSIRAGEEY